MSDLERRLREAAKDEWALIDNRVLLAEAADTLAALREWAKNDPWDSPERQAVLEFLNSRATAPVGTTWHRETSTHATPIHTFARNDTDA